MKTDPQRRFFIHKIAYQACCLMVILGLLLSACQTSTPGSGSTTVPKADGEETTAQPSEQPADVPADNGNSASDVDEHPVITFALGEWERSRYEALAEQFNTEHPEITVQIALLPEFNGDDIQSVQDYYRALASAGDTFIASGVSYIPDNYLRDLQPMMETDATFEPDDFWGGALEACQDMEGRQLGIPLTVMVSGIFYDQEAFDAAGVPYPKPGWTLEDFQKAITALARQDGDEIRYGFAEQSNSGLTPYIETVLNANDGEIDVAAIQALAQWYIDLIRAKAIYTPAYVDAEDQANVDWNKQWQDWQNLFEGENRPAMWEGGLSDSLPGAEYVVSDDDPLAGLAIQEDGFAPLPVMTDGSNDNTNSAWTECVAISAGSKNPRAAWEWLNFLSKQRTANNDSYAWERMQTPARISVADASGYWEDLPEGLEETLRYIIEHSWYSDAYSDNTPFVSDAIYKAAAGKTDLASALEEVREQAKSAVLMTEEAPSPTPNTTPIVVATPKPTLSADTNEVEYFYQAWGPERDSLQALIDAYNESHPDTTITLRSDFNYSGEDYLADMAQKFDCFTWYPSYLMGTESKPDFLALDALAEAEGPEFLQDFDANQLDSFRQDGKLMGLPAFSQPQIMAYNADLLAKRGIQPPKNDWTFDDFIALATQAASQDEADKSYGLIFSQWDNLVFDGRGIRAYDLKSEPPAALFDSPEFASGLAWIDELFKAGTFLVQNNDNYMDVQEAVSEGKVAFWTSQTGQEFSGMYTDEELTYKIGVAPMPAIDNPTSSFIYWGNVQAHYISAQTQNQQACWDWIKYLSEQPNAFGGVPARKSVANSPAWETVVGKEYAEIYRLAASQVKHYSEEDIKAIYSSIEGPFSTWQREITDALLKGEDYAKLIPQAQQKAEAYLACMASVDVENLDDTALQEEVARCAQQADPDGEWMINGGGGGGGG